MKTLTNISDRDELDPLIVRTHYGDDRAWDALKQLLLPPAQDADTDVPCFVDDPQWDGASVDDVLAAVAADEELRKHLRVVFLADRLTMETVDHPLLVVTTTTRDECEDDEEWEFVVEYGREFRAVPQATGDIHVNLQLANMDYPDFSSVADRDPDGIYRNVVDPGQY
ncbi:hypothetical protein [Streptomyces sp. PSKA30]|uniref:DUF6924 domain-containing protein n=1 Tax=Streptomyces sp. PSKA30 TaxID=2874597 RepID=UPI001CD14736|nr:hypothetical protein [Streptomyces sp. PSKA30]MBZ9644051.1 hypothetical protein [Streptomyces sp. PSKA30]